MIVQSHLEEDLAALIRYLVHALHYLDGYDYLAFSLNYLRLYSENTPYPFSATARPSHFRFTALPFSSSMTSGSTQ
jgi:hypothetical protein